MAAVDLQAVSKPKMLVLMRGRMSQALFIDHSITIKNKFYFDFSIDFTFNLYNHSRMAK